MDDHNIEAPYNAHITTRKAAITANRALDEIMHTALRASAHPTSTAEN